MSSEIELKPCPFCGAPGELREYVRGWFAAGCPDPDCIGTRENVSGESSQVEAAARWNTRTPPSSATPGDWVRELDGIRVALLSLDSFDDAEMRSGALQIACRVKALRDRTQPQERAGSDAGAKSALVQKAIGQAKALGEWDGKTFNEELSDTLRQLTRPQPASDASGGELPELPAPARLLYSPTNGHIYGYTAEQMRAYASRALAESRAEAATLHESHRTLNDALTRAATAREAAERSLAEAVNRYARLLGAARAAWNRWESPLWKEAAPTAGCMNKLRDAIQEIDAARAVAAQQQATP